MSNFTDFRDYISNSFSFRILVIGILALILLIPANMIENLIYERQQRRNEVVQEVSSKWGYQQNITGPVLTIPYKKYVSNDSLKYSVQYAHFLPEQLNIDAEVDPELRARSIYEVVLYNARMNFSGNFAKPDFEIFNVPEEHILWDDAYAEIGITDMRGINKPIVVKWNNNNIAADPGILRQDISPSGVAAPVNVAPGENYKFSFDIDIKGSDLIYFTPIGKKTDVQLLTSWEDKSFDGSFLPDNWEEREEGVVAEWSVLHLNRNYPQQWINNQYNVQNSQFGLKLLIPVDQYQKSTRAVKYALLFIGLTFLFFFFSEILNKRRVHIVQYFLVGLAICVFYTLLVALSEHINFNLAYLLASVAVVGMISTFIYSIFKSIKVTALTTAVLATLYIFLFTVLQLEDLALLLGSIGLFIALAIVMYLSRKIDWHGEGTKENTTVPLAE